MIFLGCRSPTIPILLSVVLVGAFASCGSDDGDFEGHRPQVEVDHPEEEIHPVRIQQPAQPRVLTGKKLPDGTPETVACGTCHSGKTPNLDLASSSDLKQFHLGMTFAHGKLSCLSCHNAKDYDTLKLADGKAVLFPDTMKLCAQCHGPQHRDYQRGSHGGMTGYWDLTKGPRTRNHCITCHDPHAPAFPQMMPVFKPIDLDQKSAHGRSSKH
ncbi:MAG: formate-dependent nitrite reductase cytochrome c552 subunit [Verrucomicrobiales bacterium]|jgi:formate-dependent nitrite reductase cytochrome c552 subunit